MKPFSHGRTADLDSQGFIMHIYAYKKELKCCLKIPKISIFFWRKRLNFIIKIYNIFQKIQKNKEKYRNNTISKAKSHNSFFCTNIITFWLPTGFWMPIGSARRVLTSLQHTIHQIMKLLWINNFSKKIFFHFVPF